MCGEIIDVEVLYCEGLSEASQLFTSLCEFALEGDRPAADAHATFCEGFLAKKVTEQPSPLESTAHRGHMPLPDRL